MVHRAPDSRLLTNLITHEKEYIKHIVALFPLSHTALASLSAYAAASPSVPHLDAESSPAQVIAAVVDVLAAADDALQRYTHTLDAWREQLVSLKDLEDDLSAVLRDKDILVTRLIKASKATRDAHRSSKLIPNLGSASFSSLPSTNTSYTTGTSTSGATSNPAATNTKLAQAQAELQACEAHLVAKERELDARRISIAREGLGARCRALVDCGWVWGEMGKQGLRALQALSANIIDTAPSIAPKTVRTSVSASVIPSYPALYTSDVSSVTPSQSASQTAVRPVVLKDHFPEAEIETPRPSTQRRTTHTEDVDLTVTVPPAHSISDLALPTVVRSQPSPDPAPQPFNIKPTPVLAPPPVPRRKRTPRARRPPSQHILEVSDEGSDGPSSNDHNVVGITSAHIRAPFPTIPISSGSHDTSSEDDPAIGPFEVVENNPFDVIRRSIIGPSPSLSLIPTVPSPSSLASASVPDVRTYDTPSKAGTAIQTANSTNPLGGGTGPNLSPPKRERRTSMAFFGSLRGLFRKPKERDRVVTEWEGHASPNTSTTHVNGKPGWVTRTDARIKGRAEDSEDDPVPTPMQASRVNLPTVGRQPSGARLRKGRPGATRAPENAPHATSIDGWITDNPGGANGDAATGLDRSRTRRGTMKRRKISVADLRGSEQGHTDGEADGRTSLERVASSKGIAKVPEGFVSATVSRHTPDVQVTGNNRVVSGAESNASVSIQRSTTTIALSGHKKPDKAIHHRRSASLSLVHTHATSTSLSSLNQGARTPSSGSSNGSMSWRKPPPAVDPPPQIESRSRSPSPPKAPAPTRRPAGSGHAHTPSLMSIVADVVTRQQESGDRARSMDVPRAPRSVLREAEVNGRSAKRASLTIVGESAQQPRVVKMPLRSALRNPSRTPSPVLASVVSPPAMEERVVSPLSLRDSASVSSYETGRESLDGDRSPRARLPSVPRSGSPARSSHTPSVPPPSFSFPPPPVDPPPAGRASPTSNPNAGDVPSSSVSTETPPVARRKSVRVSLQPTFSPTPPALCDEDGVGYAPWTTSFATRQDERGRARARLEGRERGRKGEDVWVDSSDEDEAYSRARRLLSGAREGKGKA
ncbi:hypothetical protein JVU11DRAFT_12674 [Chiua virens]|nr:hypothetical protein JVU11DRAFT_12674 [Chiua virens]